MRYLIALLLCAAAWGQPVNPPPAILKGTPPGGAGGACSGTPLIGYLASNGTIYTCQSGVWTASGGGGGGTVNPANIQSNQYTLLTIGGSTPTYTATASPTLSTGYTDGMVFWLQGGALTCDGTTAITLNIDGKGAKQLYSADMGDATDAPLQAACGIVGYSSWVPIVYRQSRDAFGIVSFTSEYYSANVFSIFLYGCTDYTFTSCTLVANQGTDNTFVGKTNASKGFYSTGTTFTASGCSNGTLVGGSTAGKFTSGDSGGSCSIVITMGASATATTGWACHAQDLTAPAKIWGQTASNATTATFLSPAVTTSGDVVSIFCVGY